MSMSKRDMKLIGIGVLALLVVVVLIQNTGPITVRFLFWHITMSRVIFIPVLLLIGFLIGYVVATARSARHV